MQPTILATTCLAALLAGCFPDPPALDATDTGAVDARDGDQAEDGDVADLSDGEVAPDVVDTREPDTLGDADTRPVDATDVADTDAADDVGSDVEADGVAPECDDDEDCTRLDAVCVEGTCDAGTCVATELTGTTCDDGLRCTEGDTCDVGVCKGTAVVCAALSQCHDPGECDAGTGLCSNPMRPPDSECDDALACTTDDVCNDGVCAGAAVVCAPLDQCHDAGVCDTTTGNCSNPASSSDTECDDGLKCTASDTCNAGLCEGVAVVCAALDQCHDAGECDTTTGACSNPSKPDTTECDDTLKCTENDTCTGGVCAGTAVVCTPVSECSTASCEAATGGCISQPKENALPCSDGDACTVSDKCLGGFCDSGAEPDDSVGDWVLGASSTSRVVTTGVSALGDGAVAVFNIEGTASLRLDSKGTPPFTVNAPANATRYVVVARYSGLGVVEWATPILWSLDASSDALVLGRGGPVVHGTTAITVGFGAQGSFGAPSPLNGATVDASTPVTIGAVRLTATGVPIWLASVQSMFVEFGDLVFPYVCASNSGRVGLIYTVHQNGASSYATTILGTNVSTANLTPEMTANGGVLTASFSVSGALVDYAWTRDEQGSLLGTACAIDDTGSVLAAGLAGGSTITAQNSAAGPSMNRTFAFNDNDTYGWMALFSPAMAPTAIGGMGSSVAGSKNGYNVVRLSSDGLSVYAAGIYEGAISVASTADGVIRTLPGDVSPTDPVSHAALVELDRGLKLQGGSRVRGTNDNWIQTIVETSEGLLVSGGGKNIDWGVIQYVDDFTNYFVGLAPKSSRVAIWGVPLSPADSPISGDFTAESFELQTIAASQSPGGAVFAAGSIEQTAELGWSVFKTLSPAASAMGFIVRLNSAGGLVCGFD